MVWVIVFLVIAVAGVVFLAFWLRWLLHKAADVASELQMLSVRLDELGELLGQIKAPGATVVAPVANQKASGS